jgi:CHAT domain-containing protein
MTAVIQPDAPNYSPLPGTKQELERILERVPSQWLTLLSAPTQTTVQNTLSHLRESSIMHFACHGIQDVNQPLDSGLILSDGRLKIPEIMRKPKNGDGFNSRKHMSLAFLSACETAKGNDIQPDEAIHLAATFMFAGFRGVVGTLWWVHLYRWSSTNPDPCYKDHK